MGALSRCDNCGAKIENPLARFCSKCGESLLTRYQTPAAEPAAAPGGWKSIPALVRFSIWLIVIPVLFGFASCMLLWLGVIASSTR